MFLELFLFAKKKMKFLRAGFIVLYFQGFPWHFNFMRGHSLVELTEHDDSAAAIILVRMARGWHYAKLSISSALRLSFAGMCNLLFLFLSLCRFCLFVFFFCSHWSLVDVPLIFFCPADHVPDWQPRILLGFGLGPIG